jgi:TolB protein
MTMHTSRSVLAVALATIAFVGPSVPDGLVAATPLNQDQVSEIELSLRNPSAHPKVGVPDFSTTGLDAAATAHAKTVADVLWADLDFEREYDMIPRANSASIPVAPANALPYDRWTQIGADFVLVGQASAKGTNLVLQLRLIAVKGDIRGREYFGVQYECGLATARGPRDCAHQIADDFHKQLRALDGVARTKIAFNSDRDAVRVAGRPTQSAASGKEIYIADYDGANPLRLTVNRSINISPVWSPDGGLLAYTSYSSGFPDIYVANLREPGRGLGRPAGGTERVHNQLAAWSPDGSRLAFVSNRSGNFDIWTANRDGSDPRNLTNNAAADSSPTWSPDGSQIAFTSDRAGANQLYVMSSTGAGQRRIVDQRVDRPTWSSLNFIAFTLGGNVPYDVAIYDFNKGGVIVLTDGRGTSESPAVAPNGRHIAFVTTRWGRYEIAVMDRTGQRVKRITEVGNNGYPNWQPIVRR